MAEQIKDGTGSGFLVKVDNENRLLVHSDISTEEHNISHQFGLAFFANTTDTANTLTLATGNTYNLLYLENSDAERIINIERISVSVDTAGVVLVLMKNMILGSVGDNNVHTPVNLNFESQKTASGVFHNWDETGTAGISGLSGGTVLGAQILGVGPQDLSIEASMVLSQSNNLIIRMVNGTGGNVESAVAISFFYEAV